VLAKIPYADNPVYIPYQGKVGDILRRWQLREILIFLNSLIDALGVFSIQFYHFFTTGLLKPFSESVQIP